VNVEIVIDVVGATYNSSSWLDPSGCNIAFYCQDCLYLQKRQKFKQYEV